MGRIDDFVAWYYGEWVHRMATERRFNNCACDGSWRSKSGNWRVLEAGSSSSLLYCLRCRFEWRSKAKYRLSLPSHSKQVRGTVTDAEILERLFERRDLHVCPISARVWSLSPVGRFAGGWVELQQVADSHDSGYRFVNVSYKGRKRKVGVHVLQMMNHMRSSIPEGFDVDHIKSPRRPEPKSNALSNLRIVKSRLNQSGRPDQSELDFMGEEW